MAGRATSFGASRWAPLVLAAAAAWSIAPPYLAALAVDDAVEVVDHVVPGVISLLAAIFIAVRARAGDLGSPLVHAATGICMVGGLWETLTHVSLVADAGKPGHPAGSVVLHASAGPLLLATALWCLLRTTDRP